MQTWEPDPKPNKAKEPLRSRVRTTSDTTLPLDTELPERQQNVLRWAIEHGKLSLQQLENLYPNQSRRTFQRDLKTLMDLGWLASSGETSQSIYGLPIQQER
jgi:predicted HTH transcriptional regulator